jgi:hypothetical protein
LRRFFKVSKRTKTNVNLILSRFSAENFQNYTYFGVKTLIKNPIF